MYFGATTTKDSGGYALKRNELRHRWRRASRPVAFTTAAALAVAGVATGVAASNADQRTLPTGEVSAAHSHFLYVPGLGLDVAGAGVADTKFSSGTASSSEALNVALLNGLADLNLGTLSLPLLTDGSAPGLLDLGSNIGLVQSYAISPSEVSSISASGAVNDQGAINLDLVRNSPGYEPASLDLTHLFSQLNITGLTDELLDGAKIELGVLSSRAEKTDGVVDRSYALADLNAELSAPILGTVTDAVDQVVGTAGTAIDGLVGPGGALTATVSGLVNAINLNIPLVGGLTSSMDRFEINTTGLVSSVRSELLTTTINNATATSPASIEVDLATGKVQVDLEQLLIGPGGKYEGLGLNGLPANTDLLEAETVEALASGLLNALTGAASTYPNSLTANATRIVQEGLYSLEIGLDLGFDVRLLTVPVGGVSASLLDVNDNPATLGGLLGQQDFTPVEFDLTGSGLLGGLLNPLLGLLSGLVTDLVAAVGQVITPVINTAVSNVTPTVLSVLNPLLDGLLGNNGALLKQVLNALATITINEQTEGDLGPESYTVRALAVRVLPGVLGSAAVGVEIASSTITAEDPAAELTANPAQVVRGDVVTLSGQTFTANSPVTVLVNGVEDPALAGTTDASGVVTASWTVPNNQAVGTVTFTATDGAGRSDTATTEVVLPALTASNAVQGGTVSLTGSNFVPGEDVTISLPDGTTVVVTADSTGGITSQWAVPHTTAPGAVNFVATGESGRTASATAQITRAVATLSASPNPVEPGNTVTLTGGNFAPGEAVTLTPPASCIISAGLPVTADQNGAFTVTCVVDSSLADGTTLSFEATGYDSGRTANATTLVDSQPDPAANANASASAAASAQANGNNEVAAQAAALAAAMADNSTSADAAADPNAEAAARAAARANVEASASADASVTATSTANASAQAAAQVTANSTATATADGSAAISAQGTVDARAASQAAANSAASSQANASADASQDATANVQANANASASASASARANGNQEAAAQAAAQAAAYSAANSDASAASTADATAAADAAAYTSVEADASANASGTMSSSANSAAVASATSTAQATSTASAAATASADQNADSDANGDNSADFDSASAARAAAMNSATADSSGSTGASADASQDAAANVRANANASASASASADADSHSNPAAQAAAQAAAFTAAQSDASASATANSEAAAQAAARASVQADATANASQNAGSSALAAALSTADTSAAQDANSTAAADVNAEASSAAAAQATASADASTMAAADVNASASAAASAQADSNANAAAQAAAETAAMADASTTVTASATARANANAEAAAAAAAQTAARANVRADASATASQDTSAQANAAANTAAQASADHTASTNAAADARAEAEANANASSAAEASARQAANADSTADAAASAAATASATARAGATSTANASAQASAASQAASQGVANASGGQKLSNTGAAQTTGIAVAAIVLLLVGGLAIVASQRRKAAKQ